MTNIIVVSFTDETKAIDAMHKLIELDSFGDISIYEKIMVRKTEGGELEILKVDGFEGWRTLTGMGVGSLLGLLGGPIGFVIGMYTGTAIGAIADINHYDFADDFVARVKNKLTAGMVSIIAEIDEDSSSFVDTTLKPFGAVITRSDVDFEYDQYVNEQIDKIEDDIAEQRAALKKSIGDDKMKIAKKIAALKEKRKAAISAFLSSAKATETNMKNKTTAGISKVKLDVTEFVNGISNEVDEERAARITRRIARHEAKVKDLTVQLKELQTSLVKQN